MVALLRLWFRHDGAEGETVHALCDAAVAMREKIAQLEAELEAERAEVATLRARLAEYGRLSPRYQDI